MKKSRDLKIIYFDDLMPRIQIGREETDINYQKAFLDREEKEMSEYCRNETTWD